MSIDQKDAFGERTEEETARFKAALSVMGCCYASITGTAVLLCRLVPEMPPAYEGSVCMWNVAARTTEDKLKQLLGEFGTVTLCKLEKTTRTARVRFARQEEAQRAVSTLSAQEEGIGLEYNSRQYDGEGGRGWPKFEQGASCTTAAYLTMATREGILPMRFSLAQASRPKVIDITDEEPRVPDKVLDPTVDPIELLDSTIKDISNHDSTVFTGKADREAVQGLLKNFSDVITEGLSRYVLSRSAASDSSNFDDLGAVVYEMAGACWLMPDLKIDLDDISLISTLRSHATRLLKGVKEDATDTDPTKAFRELWGPGGCLTTLALRTTGHDHVSCVEKEGLLDRTLCNVVEELMKVFLVGIDDDAPKDAAPKDVPHNYSAPPKLHKVLSKPHVCKRHREMVLSSGKVAKRFPNSFVHHHDAALWSDDACEPLEKLVELVARLTSPAFTRPPGATWLAEAHEVQAQVHGDLNLGNILIDVQGNLWLIDFADSRSCGIHTDAVKAMAVLLFEHYPIPLTFEELRTASVADLVDLLDVSKAQASKLHAMIQQSHSLTDIRKAVAGDEALTALLVSHVADDAIAQRCAREACDVVDALLAPVNGQPPELWEMCAQTMPNGECTDAQRETLRLCTDLLNHSVLLASRCSLQARAKTTGHMPASSSPPDLHSAHLLCPLLVLALSSLRYRENGAWRKRVAWHASQRIAATLVTVLQRKPIPSPENLGAFVQRPVAYAAGQVLIQLSDHAGLEGGQAGQLAQVQQLEKDGHPLADDLLGIVPVITKADVGKVCTIEDCVELSILSALGGNIERTVRLSLAATVKEVEHVGSGRVTIELTSKAEEDHKNNLLARTAAFHLVTRETDADGDLVNGFTHAEVGRACKITELAKDPCLQMRLEDGRKVPLQLWQADNRSDAKYVPTLALPAHDQVIIKQDGIIKQESMDKLNDKHPAGIKLKGVDGVVIELGTRKEATRADVARHALRYEVRNPALEGGEYRPSFRGCSQLVLPWTPSDAARATMASLAEEARALGEGFREMTGPVAELKGIRNRIPNYRQLREELPVLGYAFARMTAPKKLLLREYTPSLFNRHFCVIQNARLTEAIMQTNFGDSVSFTVKELQSMASGVKWWALDVQEVRALESSESHQELVNKELSAALSKKMGLMAKEAADMKTKEKAFVTFERDEWEAFSVKNLTADHYVKHISEGGVIKYFVPDRIDMSSLLHGWEEKDMKGKDKKEKGPPPGPPPGRPHVATLIPFGSERRGEWLICYVDLRLTLKELRRRLQEDLQSFRYRYPSMRLLVQERHNLIEARVDGFIANKRNTADSIEYNYNELPIDPHGANRASLESELRDALTFTSLQLAEGIVQGTQERLLESGLAGARAYAAGQALFVFETEHGKWTDAVVISQSQPDPNQVSSHITGLGHDLKIGERRVSNFALHPWNHAPHRMGAAVFETLRIRQKRDLLADHSAVVDALSAVRLHVQDQCVPVTVTTKAATSDSELRNIATVEDLWVWLRNDHTRRCDGTCGNVSTQTCLLLTAPPAAGKTCLMSQLIVSALHDESTQLIPILVKVQKLQAQLLKPEYHDFFRKAWNWIDASLQCVHGSESDEYRFLRQAMMARRALILLDGIDEGGRKRSDIERHVTKVLAPQGHTMLVTSRPNSVDFSRYLKHFHSLQLEPLTVSQQNQVIAKRLGAPVTLPSGAVNLSAREKDALSDITFLQNWVDEKCPVEVTTGLRITGNPLMLSMVISIFQNGKSQSRADRMPSTIAELYGIAADAMLQRVERKERGKIATGATTPHLNACAPSKAPPTAEQV